MDAQNHPDPLREAANHGLQRAVQVASCVATAARASLYHQRAQARVVAERDERGRRALQAQIRAERDAARTGWASALDQRWLREAGVLDTARVWGAAMPYADRNVPWYEATAATAMRAAEEHLEELHPYAMARYQRLRGDGLSPAEAMSEAAGLFARSPHARDAPFRARPFLSPGTGQAAEWVADSPASAAGGETEDAPGPEVMELRGRSIVMALQEGARADGRDPLAPDELRIVLDTLTNLPGQIIERITQSAAAESDGSTAASRVVQGTKATRPWQHDFPAPICDVVAAAAASPAAMSLRRPAASLTTADRAGRPAGPGHGQ